MANRTQKHYWQFHVTDGGDHADDNGAADFESKAQQLAATLGCRVMKSKNVSREQLAARKWIVSGTVILAK